jgi:hypothetical protein
MVYRYLMHRFLLFSFFYASSVASMAQSKEIVELQKVDKQEKIKIFTYHINTEKVSQRTFKKALSKIEQIENTWMCIKTNDGGITRYQGKDRNGTLYQYEAQQEKDKNGKEVNRESLTVVGKRNPTVDN